MRTLVGLALFLVFLALASIQAPRVLNGYQTSGELALPGLSAPVSVRRDRWGVPYITAETIEDALTAQGFVVGQDRLFQLEAARRAAAGRLSEVFGEATLEMDREARVIGFHRLAARQVDALNPQSRARIDAFVTGLNAVALGPRDQHPLEMRLLKLTPEPWTPTDVMAIVFLGAWGNSANFQGELTMQAVIEAVGPDRAAEIAPRVVNPDAPDLASDIRAEGRGPLLGTAYAGLDLSGSSFGEATPQPAAGGSNNWAASGPRVGQTAAVVANDPHLDPRDLPGFWHPVGIATPDLRLVGVSAGFPGIIAGRNDDIAFGLTNAYGDVIDLYVEKAHPTDPDLYLEGDVAVPFETREEIIRVLDEDTAAHEPQVELEEGEIHITNVDPDEARGVRKVTLTVRHTRRGPVISDHGLATVADGALISLRWAAAEAIGPSIGLDEIWTASSVDEALDAVADTKVLALNVVVGDVSGRIARRASGAVPIRVRGDGSYPLAVVDGTDAWNGFIPGDQMPQEIDPASGWTGTANHFTAPADYPYVYTTYASPSYRYRRMQALFGGTEPLSAQALSDAQYDVVNLYAAGLTPLILAAIENAPHLAPIADALRGWDYQDRIDDAAPTVFQAVSRAYARAVFEDELGEDLADGYLESWYLWQERLDAMTKANASAWFDDVRTPQIETRDDLLARAAAQALSELTERLGPRPRDWTWGEAHQARFRGPLRLTGLAGRATGAQAHPKPGSGETLDRALYPFTEPYDPRWMASMRMVADLNDPDKVRAVLGGGVVGRTFSPHLDDQIKPWLDGSPVYWWFSEAAIAADTRSTLTLTPG